MVKKATGADLHEANVERPSLLRGEPSSADANNPHESIQEVNRRAKEGFAWWLEKRQRKALDEQRSRVRYPINLGLFLVLVVLIWLYFNLHLRDAVTQGLFFGIPASVWAIWKLVQSWNPGGRWMDDPRSITRRVVGNRAATVFTAFALGLVLLLFATTSSLYLEYSPSGKAEKVEVVVLHQGKPWSPNLKVTSSERVQGYPFISSIKRLWKPMELEFHVGDPVGYRLENKTLYAWSALRLRYPEDFKKIDFFVCRLIPGEGLQTAKPFTGRERASVWDVEILVDSRSVAKEQVSYDCIYFGASRRAIDSLIKYEELERRKAAIRRTVSELSGYGPNERVDLLASSRRILETPELDSKSKVEIVIYHGKTAKVRTVVELPLIPGIHNVEMEKSQ